MSELSAILSLPYLQPSQAQKHVTHNEALRQLDIVTQLAVESLGATMPPGLPQDGETHALGAGTTGAWAGQDGQIASFADGGWHFVPPRAGWRAYDRATGALYLFDGVGWVLPVAETRDLEGIGIGTAWDAVNRLSVAAPASLLSHAGQGHQLKINKAAAGDTASLLFQTGWSGRAEMGLAGTDDFAVKVSADGATWKTGLMVGAATGQVGIGTTSPESALHAVSATAPDLRVEVDGWGTARLIAKGRRTGSNTDIARLSFINQESTPGEDAAEAAITAIRKTDPGDIQLSFTVSAGGMPVEAFAITPTGALTRLTVFSNDDHLILNSFGPETSRIVTNRGLTLSADPANSEGPGRSEVRIETDGVQRAVIDAAGRLGVGVAAPLRRAHIADAMRLEPGPEPAAPGAGDIYFDATTASLRCHDGTVWHDLF